MLAPRAATPTLAALGLLEFVTLFQPAAVHAMRAHAVEAYPRESVGMVVDGAYHRLGNEAEDPEHEVAFDERVAMRHGTSLQAIVHSHPNGPAYPSVTDQEAQLAWGVPFGLIPCNERDAQAPIWFGDGSPRPCYLPDRLRPVGFRWYVHDCYEAIRDAFWQGRGIRLKQFPREWGAWKAQDGKPAFSGYLHHYREAGFVEAARPEPWDLALIRFTDVAVPSHAGVALPGEMLLHHLGHESEPVDMSRPLILEPMGRWVNRKRGGFSPVGGVTWLRYQGAD